MSAVVETAPATSMLYVQRTATKSAVPELSLVRIVRDVVTYDTAEPVPAGSVGTVVLIHDDGAAYDVEFDEPAGVASLPAEDVIPLSS